MSRVKANTGRILIGTKELAYCDGIDVEFDFSPIIHYAADRQFPVEVIHGNSSMTIKVACAEFDSSDQYAFEEIAKNGSPVTVTLLEGYRGGGFPACVYTNCVVTNYSLTSKQGEVVKAAVTLVKRSDS